jgi:hypothetical protein
MLVNDHVYARHSGEGSQHPRAKRRSGPHTPQTEEEHVMTIRNEMTLASIEATRAKSGAGLGAVRCNREIRESSIRRRAGFTERNLAAAAKPTQIRRLQRRRAKPGTRSRHLSEWPDLSSGMTISGYAIGDRGNLCLRGEYLTCSGIGKLLNRRGWLAGRQHPGKRLFSAFTSTWMQGVRLRRRDEQSKA